MKKLAMPLVGLIALSLTANSQTKPNIVLIMADDVGYECFESYGSKQYKTPVLNDMAEKGIRFTHCYSQPSCTPSRVKLMTGQSNVRNYSNFSCLNKEEKTFGHMMKDDGYENYIAGKWQLYGADHYGDMSRIGSLPEDAGFDKYCLWQVKLLKDRFWKPGLNINGNLIQFKEEEYGPDICVDHINTFIDKNKDEPFFVYYPMILVHAPFNHTPDSEKRKDRDIQKNFEDMIAYMDKSIGKIVKKLDEHNLSKNTLILFVGDNGTGKKIKSVLNDVVIQGGKSLMTDGGTRVPFIAYWPGTIPGGQVCDDLVDFSDFLPTIAQATGAELPKGVTLDGQSFYPQLLGEKGNPRKSIYMYYCPKPPKKTPEPQIFARNKKWKLYADGNLYDIPNDVLEKNPVTEGSEGSEARIELQKVLDSMPKKGLKINKHGSTEKKEKRISINK